MRTREINARKYEELSNVAEVIFSYEGAGTDREIVKALDKKYDALMDKLVLDALKNQLGKTFHTSVIFNVGFMKNSIFNYFSGIISIIVLQIVANFTRIENGNSTHTQYTGSRVSRSRSGRLSFSRFYSLWNGNYT